MVAEPNNQYKWCLQEFDNEGKQIEYDLTPYPWPLHFTIKKIHYTCGIESDDPNCYRVEKTSKKSGSDAEILLENIENVDEISAKLIPTQFNGARTRYSIIGKSQTINDIQLNIKKSNKDECFITVGSASRTKDIFGKRAFNAFISIHIELSGDKFNHIPKVINSGDIDQAYLKLSGVNGVYSYCSPQFPESSPRTIKILPYHNCDQEFAVQKDTEITLPQLGEVRGVQLRLTCKHRKMSNVQNETSSENFAWAKEQAEAAIRRVSEEREMIDTDAEDGINTISYVFNEERADFLRHSLKYELMNQMFYEAASHAADNDLGPDWLDDLSDKICLFFNVLESAFQRDEWPDCEKDPVALTGSYKRSWQLWQHPQIIFSEIKKGEIPYINSSSLMEAVAKYLDLPVRNRRIDRMLVDACIASEMVAFAKEKLYLPVFLKETNASFFTTSHPFWQFVQGQLLSFAIIVAAPIALLIGAVNLLNLTANWPFLAGLGFFGLWSVLFLLDLIDLPRSWAAYARGKQKVRELLDEMHTVYMEVGNGTVVSARHIRERLNRAIDRGVVWPSEVFPLLDDIIDRGGMM